MKTKDIIVLIISVILTSLLIYALFFVKPKYTVEFEVDNKIISSIKVESGKTFKKPANPVKEGHTFVGWFLNDEEYNFDNKINKNTKITAHFEEIKEEVKTTKKKNKR